METPEALAAWSERWDWSAMEAFSSKVFGSTHRLAVLLLAADADPSRLYVEAIAKCIGLAHASGRLTRAEIGSFTRAQLEALREAELLEDNQTPPARPSGISGRTPTTYFARTNDEFWDCLQELGNRFRRPPPRPGRRGRPT